MRHALSLIFLAALSFVSVVSAQQPTARIARFSGDRAAAISYTFDDGLRDQFTLGVPILNEAGFKGTFFIIPGKVSASIEDAEKRKNDKRAWGTITWPELRQMAAQGHEIASHTWSHRAMPVLTADEVESELRLAREAIQTHLGSPALTLAFPFNQSSLSVKTAALRHHEAFRAYQLGISGKTTLESLNTWADKQVQEKKWGVVMFHAVASGYAALTDPEIFRQHLQFIQKKQDDIWVDTFATIARYEKQRDGCQLTLSGKTGQITCHLTSTLHPPLESVPLTVVIDLPGLHSAQALRGDRQLPVTLKKEAIHIEATPHAQPIIVHWQK